MAVRAWRRLAGFRALVAGELVLALAVAGGLWLLREQAIDAELRTLASLARAMALQADRTLGLADTVLRDTRDELARGLIVPGTPEADALLRERVRALDTFHALGVFDAAGARIATSRASGTAAPMDVAGRDFFVTAQRSATPRLYLSAPYVALSDGRPAVSVSLGWHDADGRFRGVLALVADPDFLEGGFQRVAATPDTRLVVHRADGVPVHPPATPGGRLDAPQLRQLHLAAGAGVAQQRLEVDGQPRLVAAAVLTRLPLTLVVSRRAASVLAGWTELAGLVGGVLAALLALTSAFGLRSARERARREGLEQRLARTRQLEALGKLAGGVAHDFNNVLAAVLGFGEMARLAAPAGSRQAAHLDQVLQAGQRGRHQVERILAFGRGQPRRSTAFALQPVVAEVLAHLQASPRGPVQVQAALDAPALVLRGDPTAVYEALMNLATNALQALQARPEGGTLRVRLAAVDLTQPRACTEGTLAPGRHARLVVADDGPGMPAEVLARVFEPFFTTRAAQGGSGLGLAVVHGIVADLLGAIDLHSAPGRGTTFTLWLPAADEPPEAEPADDAAPPRGHGEAVLVVDDEPALVALAEELLAELGYEPLGTPSAAAALEAFRRAPARFDLLLTDETMPVLSGTELARALRAIRPDLPVLLLTGHASAPLEARAAAAGVHEVLAKPLDRAALARALQRALARHAPPRLHP